MSKEHVFDSLISINAGNYSSKLSASGVGKGCPTDLCAGIIQKVNVDFSGDDSDRDSVLGKSIDDSPFTVDAGLSDALKAQVFDVKDFGSIASVVSNVIDSGMEAHSFLVCNLANVVKQYVQWRAELPMVEPFYAVKCNPDPVIVRLLASLGCSFDCATMGEIDLVVNKLGEKLSFASTPGKASNSIVYANPAKMDHMLNFAMDSGVQMTVVDGEDELYKIHKLVNNPAMKLADGSAYPLKILVRITTDDKDSICRFSKKFGCPADEVFQLLEVAKELGLHIAGVSFHVGSGCRDAGAYTTALMDAAKIFQWAEELGMPAMDVIDIGGGFPGESSSADAYLVNGTANNGHDGCPSFHDIARVVRSSITQFAEKLSRPMNSLRFIAEPGRYFVATSTTIATKVYARKGGAKNFQALYVDNGVYGSFNTVVYDHARPVPKKLTSELARIAERSSKDGSSRLGRTVSTDSISSMLSDSTAVYEMSCGDSIPTAVFGPTCDGLDQMCTLESTNLERCAVGDWLIWECQGAYTHTASFIFNGYTHFPSKFHVFMA